MSFFVDPPVRQKTEVSGNIIVSGYFEGLGYHIRNDARFNESYPGEGFFTKINGIMVKEHDTFKEAISFHKKICRQYTNQ